MTTSFQLLGQTLTPLPQRALYWAERRTLLIADPHFGKPESFRAFAVPVPGGTTAAALQRLDAALLDTGAERLVVLGDFWHARAGRTAEVVDELTAWRLARPLLALELVPGNHDRGISQLPEAWGATVHAGNAIDPPFVYSHYPDADDAGYVLCGHLHPAVVLSGRGRQALRLPAFWFGPRVGVLPAFGEFTGVAVVTPRPGDQVFVVAGDQVVPLP